MGLLTLLTHETAFLRGSNAFQRSAASVRNCIFSDVSLSKHFLSIKFSPQKVFKARAFASLLFLYMYGFLPKLTKSGKLGR